MNETDICNLAVGFLEEIRADIQNERYTKIGGNLRLAWLEGDSLDAKARSLSLPSNPPNHQIQISYALAVQIYRDAETYYDFCESGMLDEQFHPLFKDFSVKPGMPAGLKREEAIQNIFLGALTWVFFHELGHLVQEHGYIRKVFGEETQTFITDCCDSNNSKELSPRTALISHVTELSADVYATYMCSVELHRHFVTPRDEASRKKLLEEAQQIPEGLSQLEINEHLVSLLNKYADIDHQSFRDTLFLCISGIACTLYRFHGANPVDPYSTPYSSHPTPIRRLEACLPNFFEKIDAGGFGQVVNGLNREQLVHICAGAAYSAGLCWLHHNGDGFGGANHFMPKGILEDPHFNTYWKAIVSAWDEVESEVMKIKRDDGVMGLLSFTDAIRSKFA